MFTKYKGQNFCIFIFSKDMKYFAVPVGAGGALEVMDGVLLILEILFCLRVVENLDILPLNMDELTLRTCHIRCEKLNSY